MPLRRLNWTYNDEQQHFETPSGRIVTLRDIAAMLHDQAEGRIDLGGAWSGWRIRGRELIPPRATGNGPRLTPDNLAAFLRWASPIRVDNAPSTRQAGPVRLTLAYSSNR